MEGQWRALAWPMARRGCPLFQAFNQCLVDRLRAVNSRWAEDRELGSRGKEKKKKKIDKTRASPPRGRAISGGEEQHPRQPASYLPPIPIRHRYNRDNLRHPVDFPTSARGIMSLQPPPFFLPLRHFSFFATFSFKQVSQATIAREFEEGCLRDNFTPLDNVMCNLKGGGSIGCIKG